MEKGRFQMVHFRDLRNLALRSDRVRCSSRQNTVALVTGGSRGLGLELVLQLVSHGYTVICVDVVPPTRKFQKTNSVYYYYCDITDRERVNELHRKIKSEHGTVEVLLNNAGITKIKTLDTMTHEDIKTVISVNLVGAYIMMNAFLPDMMREKRGFIVNVASVLGEITPARLTSYGASKGGLIALHRSLSKLLQNQNYGSGAIKMLLVCPGKIDTSMFAKVKTPSKIFAPDIDPVRLAEQVVTAIRYNSTTTLRFPYYVNILPYFKQLSWPYLRILKRCSGMDRVTAIPSSNNNVSSQNA